MSNCELQIDGKRITACIAFCKGAPTEALKSGGLMKSFQALLPGGDVSDVLTLAVEHERVKAENMQLKEQIKVLELRVQQRTQGPGKLIITP